MEETNSFVLSNVSKNYIVSKSQIIDAINNISLTLPNKGMIFVVGRSGSGKSTLLNLLGRLDKPSSGCVYYHGSDLHSFDAKRTNLYLGNEVSFIFQEYYLLEDLSVSDNMKIAFGNSGMTRDEIERKITSALSEVGLSGYQNRKVSHLSGGEKQRIGIARAIVKDAKVILCDEPTGNLDVSNAEAILNALKRLSFKKLVVVVTHEEDLAKKYSQRTIRLSEGNILEDINWTESNDLQLEPALIEHIEEPLEKTNRPTYRKPLFSILWSNFKNTVFSSILTFLVLCVSVVVMATFIAISQYDSYDTFIDTLEFNDTYLVKVTSYIDHSVFIGDEIFLYGLSPTSERVGEGDAPEIEQLAQNLIPVAKSYYFVKHFQDFIDYQLEANQYGSYSSDVYHKTYFTDVIIVDDFSTFNQPLRYGNYPELDNEILIYDFMAMQLINTGVFPNFNSMADLVGYTLADKDTGLEITISGILSSHYGKYAYTSGGSPAEYPFESLYLSELQSIFAISGFKNLVLSEQKYVSFNSLSLYNASTSEITSDFYMRKIIILDSLETLDFILAPENVTDYGLLLSDVQVANMLGVDVSTITP